MKKFFGLLVFSIILLLIVFILKNQIPRQKVADLKQEIIQVVDTIAPQPTKILDTGLPDQHLIKTTFIPQSPEKNWDQPWQDACEEAALLTVDFYYKNQTPTTDQIKQAILDMIDFETQQNWTHDVNLVQMATVSAQYLGYKTEIIDNPTVEIIKKYLVQDTPVIIPAAGKTLFKENSHFRSGGPYYHNLTVLGYDDRHQQFTVHDVGTQFGAYFKYSYPVLIDSIHDFPASGKKEDIDFGAKKILILLK